MLLSRQSGAFIKKEHSFKPLVTAVKIQASGLQNTMGLQKIKRATGHHRVTVAMSNNGTKRQSLHTQQKPAN